MTRLYLITAVFAIVSLSSGGGVPGSCRDWQAMPASAQGHRAWLTSAKLTSATTNGRGVPLTEVFQTLVGMLECDVYYHQCSTTNCAGCEPLSGTTNITVHATHENGCILLSYSVASVSRYEILQATVFAAGLHFSIRDCGVIIHIPPGYQLTVTGDGRTDVPGIGVIRPVIADWLEGNEETNNVPNQPAHATGKPAPDR